MELAQDAQQGALVDDATALAAAAGVTGSLATGALGGRELALGLRCLLERDYVLLARHRLA